MSADDLVAARAHASPVEDHPGPDPKTALLVCILASSLVGADGMMTTVALPSIAEGLDAGLAEQQWVVAAFLLALGGLLVLGGSLGDTYDRWRVLGTGVVTFGAASVGAAMAPTPGLLIACRFLQGAAAALVLPGTLSVITTAFRPQERARAIAAWTSWTGLSVIAAPPISGLVVDRLSWRATYAFTGAATALVALLVLRSAPTVVTRARPSRSIDWVGAAIVAPAVGGLALALARAPQGTWGDPLVVGALTVGLGSTLTFIWWERQVDRPLVPLAIFANRQFSVLSLVTFLLYGALISSGVYTVLFLTQTAGHSASVSGLLAAGPVAVLFALSRAFGTVADRHDPRWFVGAGSLLVGGGILLLLRIDANADLLTVVLPSVTVHGLGLAMLVAPLTAGVLSAVDDAHAGVASGLNNALARLGSLVGIVVVGAVITAQFSSSLAGALESAALGPGARTAIEQAADRPLVTTPTATLAPEEHVVVERVLGQASVRAFRMGVGAMGGTAILAALVCAVGSRRPGAATGRRGTGAGPRLLDRDGPLDPTFRPHRYRHRGAVDGHRIPRAADGDRSS